MNKYLLKNEGNMFLCRDATLAGKCVVLLTQRDEEIHYFALVETSPWHKMALLGNSLLPQVEMTNSTTLEVMR